MLGIFIDVFISIYSTINIYNFYMCNMFVFYMLLYLYVYTHTQQIKQVFKQWHFVNSKKDKLKYTFLIPRLWPDVVRYKGKIQASMVG